MKFVSANCPNCAALLELDPKNEQAKCEYCKSTIFVEEAVEKHRVELSGKVEVEGVSTISNLLKRAKKFENEQEYEEAIVYYERVLDVDFDNEEANEAVKRLKYAGTGVLRLERLNDNGVKCPIHVEEIDRENNSPEESKKVLLPEKYKKGKSFKTLAIVLIIIGIAIGIAALSPDDETQVNDEKESGVIETIIMPTLLIAAGVLILVKSKEVKQYNVFIRSDEGKKYKNDKQIENAEKFKQLKKKPNTIVESGETRDLHLNYGLYKVLLWQTVVTIELNRKKPNACIIFKQSKTGIFEIVSVKSFKG